MEILSSRVAEFTSMDKGFKGENVEVNVRVASMIPETSKHKKSEVMKVEGYAEGDEFAHGGFIGGNTKVFKLIEAAIEKEQVVLLRFERFRKPKVDKSTPIKELTEDMNVAKENIIRITCGIYDFDNKKWILTDEAHTDPNEDPSDLQDKIDNLVLDTDDFFTPKEVSTGGEGANPQFLPYSEKEIKAQTILEFKLFLLEKEKEFGVQLSDEERQQTAIKMVQVVGEIQKSIYGLELPNYTHISFITAKDTMMTVSEKVLPLREKGLSKLNPWLKRLMEITVSLWSDSLIESDQI